MDRERVELFTAFEWICPECGTNQFVSSAKMSLSGEGDQELRERMGLSDDESAEVLYAPDKVVCEDCEAEYDTDPPGEYVSDE